MGRLLLLASDSHPGGCCENNMLDKLGIGLIQQACTNAGFTLSVILFSLCAFPQFNTASVSFNTSLHNKPGPVFPCQFPSFSGEILNLARGKL